MKQFLYEGKDHSIIVGTVALRQTLQNKVHVD